MKSVLVIVAGLSMTGQCTVVCADSAVPAAGTVAATTANTGDNPVADNPDLKSVADLGKISVEGHQAEVMRSLQVIKRGLNTRLSNDPAHGDDVICRMNRVSGYPTQAFLRCATNRELIHERMLMQSGRDMATAGARDPAGDALKHLVGRDPTRAAFSRVDASKLQALLLQIKCDGCKDNGLVVGASE